jgi:hypothetical protein
MEINGVAHTFITAGGETPAPFVSTRTGCSPSRDWRSKSPRRVGSASARNSSEATSVCIGNQISPYL